MTVDERNRETSRQEVEAFKAEPPNRYFAYVKLPSKSYQGRPVLTTWVGDILGDIIELRAPIQDNFGGTRQYIRVAAINGRMYAGWYFRGSGDYARIRAINEGAAPMV